MGPAHPNHSPSIVPFFEDEERDLPTVLGAGFIDVPFSTWIAAFQVDFLILSKIL